MAKQGSIEWDERLTPGANARARLPALMGDYFAAGRKAADDAASGDLHRFRLRTKKLRYTLELFRPCYGPGLNQRLALLQEIQTRLGKLNDCASTLSLVAEMLPANAPQRVRIERRLNALAAKHRNSFLTYWRETFDKPGEEHAWKQYLARSTRNGRGADPARKRAPRKSSK